ncbi:hypothetical protein RchiOBHm_Chr2g0144761 [Rosa chinensis]|uniref:Uncharacterized protein n=1 Tax=Rosa chinensis TaxID=74649 RepID=A0A2P6RYF6_ROSCH|nr:hypothetical protein RchiOBHm_Chr2g0144761 [Rosa chinensis]
MLRLTHALVLWTLACGFPCFGIMDPSTRIYDLIPVNLVFPCYTLRMGGTLSIHTLEGVLGMLRFSRVLVLWTLTRGFMICYQLIRKFTKKRNVLM